MGQRLGQHFLIRTSVLRRIAAAACPPLPSLVIEIGAGKGALTKHLLGRAREVIAIESDPRLAGRLRERFRGESRLRVVEADVLRIDLSQWGLATVVGNLPYYITSPILEKILHLGASFELGVVLVQKEVAQRLTAQPGTKSYGFLTVETNLFAKPEVLFEVPPAAFRPPPKVDSAVVRLRLHPAPWLSDPDAFLRFVGHCFRQKRKTLRNNLSGIYGKAVMATLPESSLRAEQLSVDQFRDLYFRLAGNRVPVQPDV